MYSGMSKTSEHTHLLNCAEMERMGLHVPEMLRDLEKALGPQAVWKLTGVYGGSQFYIPQKSNIDRSVANQRLGADCIRWLFDKYDHGLITIPMGPHASGPLLLKALRTALAAGKPLGQIAKDHGCHIRTVDRAKRKLRDAGFLIPKKETRR